MLATLTRELAEAREAADRAKRGEALMIRNAEDWKADADALRAALDMVVTSGRQLSKFAVSISRKSYDAACAVARWRHELR